MRNEIDRLGTITKFASTRESLQEFNARAGSRAASFRLQAYAREITPDERVKICWRHRLPDTPVLHVVHIPNAAGGAGRGHVRGLMRCCSVWVCNPCSMRVALQRKSDLLAAVDNNRVRFLPLHVTYTARHAASDRLAKQLHALTEAYRRMRSGRWWQGFKTVAGVVASVRATEITYGENGWHPHFHELLFTEVGAGFADEQELEIFAGQIENMLTDRWMQTLKAEGLTGERQYALTVRARSGNIADYISKYGHLPAENRNNWTVAHEVTMQQAKKAGGIDGLTPWEILWIAGQGSRQAASLWKEYVEATKGRSQLQWSRGARDLLGVSETTDDEVIAADDTCEAEILAYITGDQWKEIDRAGLIVDLLVAADLRDVEAIETMLAEIDARQNESAPKVQCLPCSVDYDRPVFYERRAGALVCPYCGRVSKHRVTR